MSTEEDKKKEEAPEEPAASTVEPTVTETETKDEAAATPEDATKEESEAEDKPEEAPKEAPVTPGIKRTAKEAAKLNAENIKGKVFVVTGAYSGIGVETTRALLSQGGKVIVGGRNPKLQDEFIGKMKDEYEIDLVDGHVIDLGDLESVKEFAKFVGDKYPTIDVLLCNAGIMNTPPGVTKDGFEQQMGVNVIGHFLLAKMLAAKTKRVVWLSSSGHKLHKGRKLDLDYIKNFKLEGEEEAATRKAYDGWRAYQQAKLGDLLLAKEFAKRYPEMESVALHPGAINTNLSRHMGPWATAKFLFGTLPSLIMSGQEMRMKSPEQGAATNVTCASLPSEDLKNAAYYADCDVAEEAESAKDEEDAKALFDYCDEVTKKFQ